MHDNSDFEFYLLVLARLHSTSGSSGVAAKSNVDKPIRILSLEDWGHNEEITGSVSQVIAIKDNVNEGRTAIYLVL